MRKKNPAAVALGRIRSEKKAKASRENGKLGGRPKKNISESVDTFGVPLEEDVLVEMANLRSQDTGLRYAVHLRSKIEVQRTAHPEIPTLKVYEVRPGSSPYFSVTISSDPQVVPAHSKMDFFQSVSSKELADVKKWIVLNLEDLLEFWNHGGTWFGDEQKEWESRLKKV